MSVRYFTEDGNWPGSDMTDGANLLPWSGNLLLKWHLADPVSQKELNRNEAIYAIQQNRNPFIDRPDFADLIWGDAATTAEFYRATTTLQLWPNPAAGSTVNLSCISCPDQAYVVNITDLSGKLIYKKNVFLQNNALILSVESIPAGFYLLQLSTDGFQTIHTRIIKN